MRPLACLNSAARDRFSAQRTLPLALSLSFLVVGLDQFLQTAPEQFAASPLLQFLRWLSDGLMAFPLFAAAVWTGHRVADRIGLAVDDRAGCVKRALLIAAALAVAVPGVLVACSGQGGAGGSTEVSAAANRRAC